MNLSESGEVLALSSEYDNRHFTAETAAAWWDLLQPFTLNEARAAVRKHYNESTEWLMPAHIVRIIKAQHRANLAAVGSIVPSRADMTTTAAELATTKALSKAIASGELTPEAYEHYMRGNTPWVTFRQGLRELRAA